MSKALTVKRKGVSRITRCDPDRAPALAFALASARSGRPCVAAGPATLVPAAYGGLSLVAAAAYVLELADVPVAAAAYVPELADVPVAVAERAGWLGHPAGVA